jgi:hypothetical protein
VGGGGGGPAAINPVTDELGCYFYDAGSVTTTSRVDGGHPVEDQHPALRACWGCCVSSLELQV